MHSSGTDTLIPIRADTFAACHLVGAKACSLQRMMAFGLAVPHALVATRRVAVRSSSPDEDAARASFAGLYETRLGVAPAGLEAAIRHCFAACLDYRVMASKAAHGIDLNQLRMALIVQQHIDSDVAGIGFSINPASDDVDEGVVDANWGLGESLVSGNAHEKPVDPGDITERCIT